MNYLNETVLQLLRQFLIGDKKINELEGISWREVYHLFKSHAILSVIPQIVSCIPAEFTDQKKNGMLSSIQMFPHTYA